MERANLHKSLLFSKSIFGVVSFTENPNEIVDKANIIRL